MTCSDFNLMLNHQMTGSLWHGTCIPLICTGVRVRVCVCLCVLVPAFAWIRCLHPTGNNSLILVVTKCVPGYLRISCYFSLYHSSIIANWPYSVAPAHLTSPIDCLNICNLCRPISKVESLIRAGTCRLLLLKLFLLRVDARVDFFPRTRWYHGIHNLRVVLLYHCIPP